MTSKSRRCLLLCKDKNFKANHNYGIIDYFPWLDVCYYAKIRILKQITTYYAEITDGTRCLLLCKDKNFKENHNGALTIPENMDDVCYYAKIRILKQITTARKPAAVIEMMFVTMQR